jgi:hypothetical protein
MLQIFAILIKTYFECSHIFFGNLALPKIGQIA